MSRNVSRIATRSGGAVLLLLSALGWAQAGGTLSGRITGMSGTGVADARVSVRSASGQPVDALTNAAGIYTIPNLPPGEYDVTVSATGFTTQTAKVTLAAGTPQTFNLSLAGTPNTQAPSLGDLGFPPDQTQGSAADQARLDKRSHMLHTHQKLGLITAAPILAAVLSSSFAGGRHSTATGRELHAALGTAAAGMYFTTAGFAIFAPKIPGAPKPRGPIKLHRILAWIHGPGMILTPILGAMAYEQKSQGEKIHGVAQAHSVVAATTAIAYGLAIASVSIKF